jgi:hypothetical protein
MGNLFLHKCSSFEHKANHLRIALEQSAWTYEGISIISGTGAVICTAIVAARFNGRW